MTTKKQPVRWMKGNIFINDANVPHAIWQLHGLAYGHGTLLQKKTVKAHHQNLFQSLTGQSMLLGLVATESPDSSMAKMLQGLDKPSAQWLKECNLTWEHQANYPAGQRLYFLVVPLVHTTAKELAAAALESAHQFTRQLASLHPVPPSERNFQAWQARATTIGQKIPSVFNAQAVGIGALRWVANHLVTRGANAAAATTFPKKVDNDLWANGTAVLPEPLIDEGDKSSHTENSPIKNTAAHLTALKRRYVRVETPDTESSYQQFGVIGSTPSAGFVFPGSEFINIAADMPMDIDFCIRMSSTPAQKVRTKNRKAERIIKDQYEQRGNTGGDITGGYTELNQSAELLSEYTAILNASEREVEIAATMTFATSGPDAESAEEQMRILRNLYRSDEWIIDVPLGGQTNLFWDFWPGSVESPTSRELKQIIPGSTFAFGVPLTTDALGANFGFRIATNVTTGRYSPVYMNLAGLAENDVSGSFAAIGELGSGKSAFLKTVASHCLDRGARLVAVDHSDSQEYAALARSLTTANIIDFMDPHQSLDPMKVFGASPRGIQETLNLMVMLLGVAIDSDEGVLLNAELQRVLNEDDFVQFDSLGGLKEHLMSEAIEPQDRGLARRVARLMDIYAKVEFGRTFFDDSLPVVDLSAQATVFCTRGMTLPSQTELTLDSARRDMSINKKVGRAAYAYLATIGTSIMYEDNSEEVLFLVDEAHHMTGSPEGTETISTAIKTGRKHKAAIGLGTHTASELGPEKLRGLIPQRFVFRSRDDSIAKENLSWLDKQFVNDEYVDLVTKNLSPMDENDEVPEERRGEALYRDQRNRVGMVKILIPREPNRARAVLTTPGKRDADPAAA